MSANFNDKHLLWWIFAAMDAEDLNLQRLTSPDLWEMLDAPAWVAPSMREKIEEFRKR